MHYDASCKRVCAQDMIPTETALLLTCVAAAVHVRRESDIAPNLNCRCGRIIVDSSLHALFMYIRSHHPYASLFHKGGGVCTIGFTRTHAPEEDRRDRP